MNEEEAKAIQEAAKAVSKSLEISEKFGGFLRNILGEGFENLGGMFADWTQFYRLQNSIKLRDKVNEIFKSRELEGGTTPLLPKHVIPILQYASLEDDDDIRDMWAGLIANAADPNVAFQIKRFFITILSEIDPLDAQILKDLDDDSLSDKYSYATDAKLNSEEIAKRIDRSIEEVWLSLSSLSRQGLIIDSFESNLESLDRGYMGFRVKNPNSNIRLSHLGKELLNGCDVT